MKDMEDVAFIVQSRLNSQRVPRKMLKPFAGTTLYDIVLDKMVASTLIPNGNVYASVYDEELRRIAAEKGVRTYFRSEESANNDNSLQKIYEWHDKITHPYVIIVSGCNPLLTVETIEGFVEQFLKQPEENLFAVIKKKNYYWNKEGALVTPWPVGQTIMNTKAVEETYEAAHVLYASRRDMIQYDRFMGNFEVPGGIKLYQIGELEAFDIDYPWQFTVAEKLYNEFKDTFKSN